MPQVVATRSIQSSFACPTSGSVHDRAEKLRPSSFSAAKVIFDDKKSKASFGVVSGRRFQITAKRAVQAEVVPVSPEDVPQVCVFFFSLPISVSVCLAAEKIRNDGGFGSVLVEIVGAERVAAIRRHFGGNVVEADGETQDEDRLHGRTFDEHQGDDLEARRGRNERGSPEHVARRPRLAPESHRFGQGIQRAQQGQCHCNNA